MKSVRPELVEGCRLRQAQPERVLRLHRAGSIVAKNYLNEEELRALNNPAEQHLIFAEGQAARRKAMTIRNWIAKLEGFLTLNDREILKDVGKVTAQLAKTHAEKEYDKY